MATSVFPAEFTFKNDSFYASSISHGSYYSIAAAKTSPDAWCTFSAERQSQGSSKGHYVFISKATGHVLKSVFTGSVYQLQHGGTSPDAWSYWEVVVLDDQRVAIKCPNTGLFWQRVYFSATNQPIQLLDKRIDHAKEFVVPDLVLTPPNSVYMLRNRASRMVATVSGGNAASGANIVQSWRDNSSSQKWQKVAGADGHFLLTNAGSSKVIEVPDNSTSNGAELRQGEDASGDNQLWRLEETENGYYKIINKHSGHAMCIHGADILTENARLIQWSYFTDKHLQWYFVPVSSNYTFEMYLGQIEGNTVHLTVGDIPDGDLDEIASLPRKVGMPVPVDTNDTALQAIVIGASVAALVLATAATVASGGTALPVVLTLLGGVTSTAGNVAWLNWPTTTGAQWEALSNLYNQTNDLLRSNIESKLSAARTNFNNHAGMLRSILDEVRKGTATELQIVQAAQTLVGIDGDLTEARKLLDYLADEDTTSFAEYDKDHPEAILRYLVEYMFIHARILIALSLLSNEYNGRESGGEVFNEANLIKAFLDESRSAVVNTLRTRQDKQAARYTVEHYQVTEPRGGMDDWAVFLDGDVHEMGLLQIQAQERMRSLQLASTAELYATDKMFRVFFNGIRKGLLDMGMEVTDPPAAIPESEVRYGQYQS